VAQSTLTFAGIIVKLVAVVYPPVLRRNGVMTENQPGYVIKMVAKPGNGDILRKLVTDGMAQANTGRTWVHCLVDDEPDMSWTFERFENEEAKTNYEESDLADTLRSWLPPPS
jgi:hypothetical protein